MKRLVLGQLDATADPASAAQLPAYVLIMDGDGLVWNGNDIQTPEVSRPYIGTAGIAKFVPDPAIRDAETVRIWLLKDRTFLWGWECWWVPIPEKQRIQFGLPPLDALT